MAPLAIDGNQANLSFAEETSLKTLPVTPVWYQTEPNSFPSFGPTYAMIARTPITALRMKNKGVVTDVDVKAGFQSDLTQRNLVRLLQGFFWADALEKSTTKSLNNAQIVMTAATTTQFQAAAGLGIFLVNHLVLARNWQNTGNNGLAHITAVASGALTTDKALTAEASPPANAEVQAVGFQFAAGDLTITVAGQLVTLGTTTADFTTLGLNAGEWIWLGGDAAGTRFATAADMGFARILSISAHAVVLDICNFAAATDNGATKTIQIFFGKVMRNATTANLIKRRSYTLERQLGNDGVGIQAEYMVGCIADQFTLTLAEAAKIVADMTFVGMDALERDGTLGILGGTRIAAAGEDAFNTSHDIVSSMLYVINGNFQPTGLYGYVSDAKIVINNGVKPNKAIGVFGAFEAVASYFDVTATMTAYFSSVDAVSTIRNSGNVGYNVIAAHENSGFVFDIPLLSLGGGENKVEADKSITVALTQSAGKCPNGYIALMSFLEYLPTVAMPS